ncbi:MAG: MerR family transcriptional regulator [Bacteroidia bacterium]
MNKIKSTFTIHDLENLSGIKAHTIRIWEKRYNLLNPKRVNRNVRVYEIDDLKKLLNISLLYHNGEKISNIASLSAKEIVEKSKEAGLSQLSNSFEINSLIIAMYSLDESQFNKIHDSFLRKNSFSQLYLNVYTPVLQRIGLLWQVEAISPAHEHFISTLIYQKIVLHSANLKEPTAENDLTHILFLPDDEIHEIKLMFLNYYLKSKGQKTVYLGPSIPFEELHKIRNQFTKIKWITSLGLEHTNEYRTSLIKSLENLIEHTNNQCFIIGERSQYEHIKELSDNIKIHNKLSEFIEV